MSKPTTIGTKYGRLTAETEPERRNGKTFVGCLCVCGTKRYLALSDLVQGKQRSCGCLAKEVSHLLRQHNEDGSPKYGTIKEYRAWSNAGQKCSNPRSASFARNGGRGIKLCDEWSTDFPRFFADMGRCPDGCSLVRLNPDEDFSRANCRWSPSKRGQVYEYRGQRRTAASWATTLGIPLGRLLDALEDSQSVAQAHSDYLSQQTEVAA